MLYTLSSLRQSVLATESRQRQLQTEPFSDHVSKKGSSDLTPGSEVRPLPHRVWRQLEPLSVLSFETGRQLVPDSRLRQPLQARASTALWTRALPVRQLRMSLASSTPSGQAQVNLGEWALICGAGRHRYWQPPLGRAVVSHQFTPGRRRKRDVRRE